MSYLQFMLPYSKILDAPLNKVPISSLNSASVLTCRCHLANLWSCNESDDIHLHMSQLFPYSPFTSSHAESWKEPIVVNDFIYSAPAPSPHPSHLTTNSLSNPVPPLLQHSLICTIQWLP